MESTTINLTMFMLNHQRKKLLSVHIAENGNRLYLKVNTNMTIGDGGTC